MNDVGKSMGSAMSDFITGAKSGKEALADFAKNIINTAVSILTEWLGVFAIYSAFPTWASGMTPADMANKTVFGITKRRQADTLPARVLVPVTLFQLCCLKESTLSARLQ